MRPAFSRLAIAAAATSIMAAPALAQNADPAPGAPGPYAGTDKIGFYHVEARLAAVEAKADKMTGPKARNVRAQVAALKAYSVRQHARNGELRDWDREHLTGRLSALERMVGLG